jgi:hypothetical protein
MRFLKLIIALTFFSTSFSQSNIVWEPEITVSDGGSYGNFRPRATIVNGDTPVVVYGKSGTENLFISKWNGSSFNTPISILPTGVSSYIADWTGPDIDSKGDTVIAVFKVEPTNTGHIYAVRSTNGGATFSDTIRVNQFDTGIVWMPSMSIDDLGNPVITYMIHDDFNWTNPHYIIATSTDAGLTYTGETEVVSTIPGEACDCCPSEVIIKNQKQVLLFRNNENNIRDIFGVLSLDNGTTFPYGTGLDNLGWSIMGCPSTGPDGVYTGDDLIIAHASAAEGKYRVYLSLASTVSDLTFVSMTIMTPPAQGNDTQNFPRISGVNDTIVMAWEEKEMANKEIFCSVAIPGLDPITSLTSFKEKANATTSGTQTNPEIIYKNGVVHLFYSDNNSGNLIYRRGVVNVGLGLEAIYENTIIHPNPSNGSFNLSKNTEIKAIVNASGLRVPFTRKTVSGKEVIELDNPVKGIYFMTYSYNSGAQRIAKIVVD